MATSVLTEARGAASAGAESPDGTVQRSQHFLTFSLGDELFGLDIRTVREIIQTGPMTPVPLMPSFVRGVINLRGAVVPVIDPRARFGRPPAALGRRSCIVIFECMQSGGERVELGLLVDAVSAVVEIADSGIEEAPSFGAAVQRDFLLGVSRLGSRLVLLLEPAKAFDIDDMVSLCEAAQAEAA